MRQDESVIEYPTKLPWIVIAVDAGLVLPAIITLDGIFTPLCMIGFIIITMGGFLVYMLSQQFDSVTVDFDRDANRVVIAGIWKNVGLLGEWKRSKEWRYPLPTPSAISADTEGSRTIHRLVIIAPHEGRPARFKLFKFDDDERLIDIKRAVAAFLGAEQPHS